MKYSVEEKKVSSLLNYLENQSREDFNKWLTGVNIFEVLKISSAEIRHSNILGWLITPNENHSLGDKFFEKVIQFQFENTDYKTTEYSGILLKDKTTRDEFLQYTNDNGVMTRPVWALMNKLVMFKDCLHGNLDNAHYLEDRVVNIPSSVRV